MFSAIVLVPAHAQPSTGVSAASGGLVEKALVRSLAALVPLLVSGLVGDAVLAGPSDMGLDRIADHAGCDSFESPELADALRQALARARRPNVFILEAGYAPREDFEDEISDILENSPDVFAPRLLRSDAGTLRERMFTGAIPARAILAPRNDLQAAAAKDGASVPALARFLGARPLKASARKVV